MCLLVAAWRLHPRYRLVVAANRDEFHARPAEALHAWDAPTRLLAGRDIQAGGTWLGVDAARRFGVITNYREMARPRRTAPSRGRLIVDYLAGQASAWDFANSIEMDAMSYAGFSLLLADQHELIYACNRADQFAQRLPPGVYGLSNHLLDTPWPKLLRVRAALQSWIQSDRDELEPLWAALADRRIPNAGSGPCLGQGAGAAFCRSSGLRNALFDAVADRRQWRHDGPRAALRCQRCNTGRDGHATATRSVAASRRRGVCELNLGAPQKL
jgi:uncharacterized protein with NRDE domain